MNAENFLNGLTSDDHLQTVKETAYDSQAREPSVAKRGLSRMVW